VGEKEKPPVPPPRLRPPSRPGKSDPPDSETWRAATLAAILAATGPARTLSAVRGPTARHSGRIGPLIAGIVEACQLIPRYRGFRHLQAHGFTHARMAHTAGPVRTPLARTHVDEQGRVVRLNSHQCTDLLVTTRLTHDRYATGRRTLIVCPAPDAPKKANNDTEHQKHQSGTRRAGCQTTSEAFSVRERNRTYSRVNSRDSDPNGTERSATCCAAARRGLERDRISGP